MLPQAIVRWPHAFSICASISVVVVLPFVPVTAMTGSSQERQPSSSSPIMSILREEKFARQRRVRIDARTQDDEIVIARILVRFRPANHANALRAQIVDGGLEQILFLGAVEHGDVRAFRFEQEARRPFHSNPLPEPRHFDFCSARFYLNFSVARPSKAKMAERIQNRTMTVFSFQPDQFEMMMDRRHGENAAAGQFETEHLQNDRDRFDDENAADDGEEQLLFTADRDHADHAADGERAGVAHENFRRMTIEPEKAEAGADERGADDRELAGERIKRDLQIFGDAKISGGVGKQRVGESDRDGATDGEAIEAVGQIDGVGRADDDEREKDEREPAHVRR